MTKAKDLLQFAGSCDDLDIEKSQKDWKTMNNPFLDERPLTDETLKELGFELVNDYLETVWKLNEPYTELHPNGGSYLFIHSCGTAVIIKTVGKVKMLIEALKGEIK